MNTSIHYIIRKIDNKHYKTILLYIIKTPNGY